MWMGSYWSDVPSFPDRGALHTAVSALSQTCAHLPFQAMSPASFQRKLCASKEVNPNTSTTETLKRVIAILGCFHGSTKHKRSCATSFWWCGRWHISIYLAHVVRHVWERMLIAGVSTLGRWLPPGLNQFFMCCQGPNLLGKENTKNRKCMQVYPTRSSPWQSQCLAVVAYQRSLGHALNAK